MSLAESSDMVPSLREDRPSAPIAPSEARGMFAERTIRRPDLRRLVPLADTTIYEMEQRGEFPKRFRLTPRCVVWSLAEVEAWIRSRRTEGLGEPKGKTPGPDVRQRRSRPVRASTVSAPTPFRS